MEPISTALAGIALVKASVDGIKSAIGTAKDVRDIASQLDSLLTGHAQAIGLVAEGAALGAGAAQR